MEKALLPPFNNEGDPIPPYSESSNDSYSDSKVPSPNNQALPLHAQLAKSRSYRITQVIKTYIEPLLLSQAASGLSKTTFLLVPSNVAALQNPRTSNPSPFDDVIEGTGTAHNNGAGDHQDEIVGFPESEYVKLVRLHGSDHTSEFWRQPPVLQELESSLKARLASSGHTIWQPSAPPPSVPAEADSPTAKKSSFWFRSKGKSVSGSADPPAEEDPTRDMKLGWRAEGEGVKVGFGETRVTLGLKEVCLRVVSEMGLYETKTGTAVAIGVEVGV
jgi:hypothetical protein